LFGLLLTFPASRLEASTCLAPGAPRPPNYPGGVEPAFPANGLFHGTDQWSRDGEPLSLRIDDELSAKFLRPIYVPTSALTEGMVFVSSEQGYCAPACSACKSPCADWRLVISPPDNQAPSQPTINIRTLLVRDPQDETGCDVDRLELTIDAVDDTTAPNELTFGAYIAATPAEVESATSFAVTFGYDGTDERPTATAVLGNSYGRMRDGEVFAVSGPFCFALAAFDRSGNVSEPSATTCLDTTDESDPTVVLVESTEGCGCQSSRTGGSGTLLLFAVASTLRKRKEFSHRR
jgi:hypothetical protein